MSDENKPITEIVRDMNRHALGGARGFNPAKQKWQSSGILNGQQGYVPLNNPDDPKAAKNDDMTFQFCKNGVPSGKIKIYSDNIDEAYEGAHTALTGSQQEFFNLTEDTDIPTWIGSPKQYNLPSNPAPEEIVHLTDWDVLALPPPVLVEAIGSEPTISLKTSPAKKQAIEFSQVAWRPAMILRCPVTISKEKPKTKPGAAAPTDQVIFELKGIPQGQRWYLDKLKLLDPSGPTMAFDQPHIFIENPNDKNRSGKLAEVSNWIIARKNLSSLARPAANMEHGKKRRVADVPLPYAASSDDPMGTMQLFQMASIVNDGGYYFRVLGSKRDRLAVSGDGVVLVIVLLLTPPPASAKDLSGKLPASANAIAYPPLTRKKGAAADEVHRVIQFEGLEHSQFSPTSPPGCLTFGWVRGMDWAADKQLDITKDTTGHAYAESLHLIDYEIRAATAPEDIIQSWIRKPDATNFDLSKNWRGRLCSADMVTPLSPTNQVGETSDGDSCQRFPKTTGQGTAVAYYSNPDPRRVKQQADYHEHRYRATVRYSFTDVYGRMRLDRDGKNHATLKLAAGFRDLYGNRIYPNCASATRTIAYTDPLIPLSEWPSFHFKACAHAGKLCVKIWYARKDPSSFLMGQVQNPKTFAKLFRSGQRSQMENQATLSGDCLAYFKRRLTAKTLNRIQKTSPHEEIVAQRELVQSLNAIVDGPSIYNERWFQHVSMRPETKLLAAKQPSGPMLRRLNRMLLEDLFPHHISPSKPDSEAAIVQQLQKLSLIADQLTGAGWPDSPDVCVKLIDVGRSPVEAPSLSGADDRGNFQYDPPSVDLRHGLIDYIRNILANPDQPSQPPWSLTVGVQAMIPGQNAGSYALRLSPLLQITRVAGSNLPQNDLPAAATLHDRILRQIRFGETRIPFGLWDDNNDDSDVEFKKVALTFSTDLSQGLGFQTAISRNRFNEHEIWFVPDTAFPKANAGTDVLYSTPRPLNVSLQTEAFIHPDFSKTTGRRQRDDFDPWHGFPVPSAAVVHANVDCDALARRAFSALERFLAPKCVTEVISPSATPLVPILPGLLASKYDLAKTLALVGNCIVPMFAETDISNAKMGISRMAADAFERSLRAFYRIDTFVSLPVSKPFLPFATSAVSEIGNFFGQTTADFIFVDSPNQPLGKQPAKPTLSDFVLSVASDFSAGGNGYITVAYNHNLKQGHEADWIKWHLSKVTSSITHVQLAIPGEETSHPFDMGRWLEFVFPPGGEVALEWTVTHPIPAIIRAIPVEPTLQAVKQLKFDALDGQAIPTADLQHCARWGWQVDFGGVYTENDTVCLEMDYFNDSGNAPSPAKTSDARGEWPGPQNVTQTLIVLDLLLALPAWSDPNTSAAQLKNFSEAAAELLNDLTQQLSATASVKEAREKITQDNYQLRVSQAYPGPGPGYGSPILFTQPPDLRMKEIYFSSLRVNPTSNFFNYSITAAVTRDNVGLNTLRLFGGSLDVKAFQPVLMLRRNDAIPEVLNLNSLHTSPSLVYKSGPVTWPNRVRVTDKWRSISLTDVSGGKLLTVLQKALGALFGNDTDFSQTKMTLRFDLRHCFKLGTDDLATVVLANPIYLFSNDYNYTTAEELAKAMADEYCFWLTEQGGTVKAQLSAMPHPTLQIGVQAAKLVNEAAVPGHIMLEVDSLEIPMDNLDWAS